MMMEEFNKMESSNHETVLRDKKEKVDEISRLKIKHAYDNEFQVNLLENDLHQEISLLKTTVGRNRDNIALLRESTNQVTDRKIKNQRPESNRVKRQREEQFISTNTGHKTPSVDFCTIKPRFCTLQHKIHKSSGEADKNKNAIEDVHPPTSCDDLVRMGHTLDGFYPFLGKEENAAKVSINHCVFNSTHANFKSDGNPICFLLISLL